MVKSYHMNTPKFIIVTTTGILLLFGALYTSYRYSQTKSSNLILPGGVTYLGQ